jgi:hypothetical protein
MTSPSGGRRPLRGLAETLRAFVPCRNRPFSACRTSAQLFRGASTEHVTPVGANSICTSPPSSWARLRSMSRVPKPRRAGSRTGGPSASSQVRRSLDGVPVSTRVQCTLICPVPLDKAPYLTAFVANSWSAIASAKAIRGGTCTRGPRTSIRFSPDCVRQVLQSGAARQAG